MSKQIFKAYFGMFIIHVKINSLIILSTKEEKSVLPIVELGKNLVVSSFVMMEDTCSLFLVSDLYCDLEKEYFQQGELNKYLRTSLFFQQWEFDVVASSLSKQNNEECDFCLGISLKLDIWVFHGLFDI